MEFERPSFHGAQPVDGYGPGFTRVGGVVHEGPLVVLPAGARPWAGYEEAAGFEGLDVLLLGTGAEMRLAPRAFREAVEAGGATVEPMSTPAACRTYNVLLAEGRRVGLALFPV
jgi:uncharacterized protein